MKKFIRKIIVLALIPVLYFGINIAINYLIYKTQPSLIENAQILIVGDSHPEKSLNPKLMKNAQNICQTAEPYILSFWKLKKIFESSKPETVILGFAPNNIAEYNDSKFSNKKYANEMFRRSYPIQNFSEIDNKINVDYKSFYKILFKQTAFYPFRNHFNYIGNYSNNTGSNISDGESTAKRHYFFNSTERGVSENSISYLDSIISLCKTKNIKLVLISPPVHKNYLDNIPNRIFNKYSSLSEVYKKST